jgi:protein-disulfide isomerase
MLSDDDLIIYPSKTNITKNIIFVFMDYSCPFCKKLHRDVVPKLNENGIEVRYIPFSRNPFDENVIKNLINVFCFDKNKDKQDAINKAFFDGRKTDSDNYKKCEKEEAIRSILQISHFMKIKGSPSIYTVKGEYIGGYNNYKKVLELIDSGI